MIYIIYIVFIFFFERSGFMVYVPRKSTIQLSPMKKCDRKLWVINLSTFVISKEELKTY